MLEKLAAIATYADENKHYDFANNATQLLKTAQLWDALRTLFDPGHTPGVIETNTPFWNRLGKGWARGKMDRNLGLVLAIMTERTKLNEKINKITAPIKIFQEGVASFYDRLQGGSIKSDNFKAESRELQKGLKETLNTITGKDLRSILKMKERLEQQQLIAAEKIKGLNEETRGNLMALLRGETLPGMTPKAPDGQPVSPENRFRVWLKKFNIARLPVYTGAETIEGKHQYREFAEVYGFNPKAVTDYFINNGNAQAEGFDSYPKEFSEMLRRGQQVQKYDDEMKRGVHWSQQKNKKVPGAESQSPMENPNDANTDPMITPPSAAPSQSSAPQVDPEAEKRNAERKRREEEIAKRNGLIEAIQERQEGKKPAQSSIPASPLASSTAERTAREITRLGRMRQLNKLSGESFDRVSNEDLLDLDDVPEIDSQDEEYLYKALNKIEKRMEAAKDPEWNRLRKLRDLLEGKLKEVAGPDMYEASPEGRETFNEENELDPSKTMLDAYEDVQSKWPNAETDEAIDLDNALAINRAKRQIKMLELAGEDPKKIDKAKDELRRMINRMGED